MRKSLRKSFLLVAVAVAAMSASTRGGAPAASPDGPSILTPDFAGGSAAPSPAPADKPVSLADAQGFDARPPEIGLDEITEARRMLASAVSAEKFMDGAKAVFVAYLVYLVAF